MARTVNEKPDVLLLIAEVFRELGYEGASLGHITQRTGIGKGSLYHFFPNGKEQMAQEVLAHVDAWFVKNVYEPLERDAPKVAIAHMWQAVDGYFRSGKRVCLVGAFALDETRDRFAPAIRAYFARWMAALTGALTRAGVEATAASSLAEQTILGIQGALVLARALGDDGVFTRTLARLMQALSNGLPQHETMPDSRSQKRHREKEGTAA